MPPHFSSSYSYLFKQIKTFFFQVVPFSKKSTNTEILHYTIDYHTTTSIVIIQLKT